MWMMVMFDLPVGTKRERQAATGFRKQLLDMGFQMAQYSVYMRFCAADSQLESLSTAVGKMLPATGQVSVLNFTDRQYARIRTYYGRSAVEQKPAPKQLELL